MIKVGPWNCECGHGLVASGAKCAGCGNGEPRVINIGATQRSQAERDALASESCSLTMGATRIELIELGAMVSRALEYGKADATRPILGYKVVAIRLIETSEEA